MNINPLIESAFKDFEINKKRIPIAFLSYTGKADTYLTYYTWQEQPANFLMMNIMQRWPMVRLIFSRKEISRVF